MSILLFIPENTSIVVGFIHWSSARLEYCYPYLCTIGGVVLFTCDDHGFYLLTIHCVKPFDLVNIL